MEPPSGVFMCFWNVEKKNTDATKKIYPVSLIVFHSV